MKCVTYLLILFLSVGLLEADSILKKPTIKGSTTFAIIVDAETYQKIGESVDAYRSSVERDGLPSYIVVDDWKNADAVKSVIKKLYSEKIPLEGFVLVGDIPIPMIRDAQHMTTAFKLDQEVSWVRSSVPSDRFYDDLDLKFTFIKQDTARKLYFYYSLDADSPQRIDRDMYSARIKSPVNGDEKYDILKKYFDRIVREKKKSEVLDNALVYTGYGYHSESLASWEGNSFAMKELFPSLYQPGGHIQNLNFAMDHEMKAMLVQKVQNDDLDLALFHAHGAVDAQLIVGEPPTFMMDHNIQAIKRFIRSKMRTAKRRKKSVDEALQYYVDQYRLPKEWFADTFTDSVAAADSIDDEKQDIHSYDIDMIAPQPRFVMFDECFNGSFHEKEYVAGKYVFGNGRTVAAVANSVNILQDVWANEHIGLLGYGVRIGSWHRFRNTLESHIIGDPTYRFANRTQTDIQTLLSSKRSDVATWKKLLKEQDVPLRSLAVTMMFQNEGKAFEQELFTIFKNDPSYNVRMAALKYLAVLRTEIFEKALMIAAEDPYEFIRRIAILWMGEVSKPDYASAVAKASMTDASERVQYSARNAMEKIGLDVIAGPLQEFANHVAEGSKKESFLADFKRSRLYYHSRLDSDLVPLSLNDTLSVKSRVQTIRTFRLYNYTGAVPVLLNVALKAGNPNRVRVTAIEAMGWYSFSYRRGEFIDACNKLIADPSSAPEVKNEALKTKNRLMTGSNDPVTP